MSSSELDLGERSSDYIDNQPTKIAQNSPLPYEADQFSPSNPNGHRKYSIKFLRAVFDSMQLTDKGELDETIDPSMEHSISDEKRLELPYVEGLFSPSNPGGHRRYSIEFLRAVARSMRPELDKNLQKIEPYSLDQLPYDSGQYKPTYPDGDKRYSAKFLKAVGEMLMPDEDATEIAPLLSERSIFPWDLFVLRSNRFRKTVTAKDPKDDIWL